MKRIAFLLVALALVVGNAFADSLNISSRRIAYDHTKGDIVSLIGGEHNYVQWTGTCVLAGGGDTDTTYWIQYSPVYGINDTSSVGFKKGQLFPRIFTLDISIASAGDSASLSAVGVSYSWTNGAAKPIRNADSTFNLIADGNYNRADYGTWTYEDWAPFAIASSGLDDYTWRYMIKCEAPGFLRLMFSSITGATGVGDNVTVTWTLTGMY